MSAEPTTATASTPHPPTPARPRRATTLIVAAAALILVAIAGVTIFAVVWTQRPEAQIDAMRITADDAEQAVMMASDQAEFAEQHNLTPRSAEELGATSSAPPADECDLLAVIDGSEGSFWSTNAAELTSEVVNEMVMTNGVRLFGTPEDAGAEFDRLVALAEQCDLSDGLLFLGVGSTAGEVPYLRVVLRDESELVTRYRVGNAVFVTVIGATRPGLRGQYQTASEQRLDEYVADRLSGGQ